MSLDQYMMTELTMTALVMMMICVPEIACLVCVRTLPISHLGASSPSEIFCQITQFKEHPHHPHHNHDHQKHHHLQHLHIHIIGRPSLYQSSYPGTSVSFWGEKQGSRSARLSPKAWLGTSAKYTKMAWVRNYCNYYVQLALKSVATAHEFAPYNKLNWWAWQWLYDELTILL